MTKPREYTIVQIKELLRRLPEEVHQAGQERIKAQDALLRLQGQLSIEKAKVRIKHYESNSNIKAKILESYVDTDAEVIKFTEFVTVAMQELEVKKLDYELKSDKNLAIRKIANVNDTYQM